METTDEVRVAELPLVEAVPGGRWHAQFVALQAPWTGRGVGRWLDLIRTTTQRPVMLSGAWSGAESGRLVGTMVGVWHPVVLARFDALFDAASAPGLAPDARPNHGCWHFISVTISPAFQGKGVGRLMVRASLSRLAVLTPDITARTLSPALGLADALGTTDGATVSSSVLEQAVHELPIVRFHCANGARLDAILPGSRVDDLASAQVTLRFAYAVPGASAVAP